MFGLRSEHWNHIFAIIRHIHAYICMTISGNSLGKGRKYEYCGSIQKHGSLNKSCSPPEKWKLVYHFYAWFRDPTAVHGTWYFLFLGPAHQLTKYLRILRESNRTKKVVYQGYKLGILSWCSHFEPKVCAAANSAEVLVEKTCRHPRQIKSFGS